MAEKILTGFCPNCYCKLDYDANGGVVQCPGCDSNIAVSNVLTSLDVTASPAGKEAVEGAALQQLISSIDTAESGLAYLENYFENFEWEDYNHSPALRIRDIREMIEKNKIKNAANPQTWLLEFKGIIVPLNHKIEGLAVLGKEMAEVYNGEDDTNVHAIYDVYKKICNALASNKDELLKTLSLDIKYAEKYGLDAALVAEMKEEYAAFEAKIAEVKACDKYIEVPAIAEAIAEKEAELVKELAAKGINAEQTYSFAVQDYQYTQDKLSVLKEFQSIRGYKDSVQYINKINRLFNFNSELFDIGGRTFTTEREESSALNVSAMGKKDAAQEEQSNAQKGTTYALFEVNNGRVDKKPVCTGISYIIASYASRLYFVKNNAQICRYNTITREETVIDKARPNDYKNINNKYAFYFDKKGTQFFFRKKLEVKQTQVGCFGSLFGKKPTAIENKNNYSLVSVDLASGNASTLVDEIVDICDYFGSKVFYTYSQDPKSDKTIFMICDIETGEKTKVLDENCLIHAVHEDKVVYSLFEPNAYNLTIRSYDLTNGVDTLLEENIYDFFGIVEGKVYYTIGNDEYQPLYSINFDGTGRTEILRNVERICEVKGGWMFALKSYGRNKALYKISTDGKKRIFLCSRVKKFVKFASGFVYYIDLANDLHIVRNDGREDRVLIADIDERNVIIDEDYIYYMREELVNDREYNYSLYRMEPDGSNTKKLAFDVLAMVPYDAETIYLSKAEVVTYEITIPKSAKEVETTVEAFNLKSYYAFNKKSFQFTNILTLGAPEEQEYEFKGGCLKKSQKVNSTFKRIPNKAVYKRAGKVEAGANFEAENAQLTQSNGQNGCSQAQGCMKSGNKAKSGSGAAGCLSANNKGKGKGKSNPGCGCMKK